MLRFQKGFVVVLLLLSLVRENQCEIKSESSKEINGLTEQREQEAIRSKENEGTEKLFESSQAEGDLVRVSLTNGIVEGRYRKTRKNVSFASFENIPFAQPPVGNLRFKDPLPVKNWEGVRNATTRGDDCPQQNHRKSDEIIGNEDCLVLDVYTPNIKPETPLPVMVHMSGGGFLVATSVFFNNPNLFVHENVILVSVNYRLGPLGFLSLDTKEVPGNAGLKDQVMALKWIKKNIAAFGGNPDKVTAFGESAGGLSCSLLQISDMTKGLLYGVISISSAGLNEWGIERNQTRATEEFATSLGLSPESENLLDQLQSQPVESLLRLYDTPRYLDFPWKVVKEKEFDGIEAFMTRWPKESYELGLLNHVPAIIGYDIYEGASFYNPDIINLLSTYGHHLVAAKWNLPVGSDLYNETNKRVGQNFFGSKKFNPEDRESIIRAIELVGDLGFFRDIDESARTLARASKKDVYYYRFSYNGNIFSNHVLKKFQLDGSSHAAELRYLFEEEVLDENSHDYTIRLRLMKLFTNFAKTGNPTPDKDDPLIPITWIPITEEKINYLEIKNDLTLGTDPDGERSLFWRELDDFVRQQNEILN